MPVQQVFPFSDLANLLLAVLVFLIIVRPAWVIDVVPILSHRGCAFVLLSLLSSTSLALLGVEIVDILVI